MKHLLVLLALVLCSGCCPEPGSTEAHIADAVNQAGYAVSKGVLGAFAGDSPQPAGSRLDDGCGNNADHSPAPWASDPGEGAASVSGGSACSTSLDSEWPMACAAVRPTYAVAFTCLDAHCAEECFK